MKPNVNIRRGLDRLIGLKAPIPSAVEKQRRRSRPAELQDLAENDLVVAALVGRVGPAFERHEAATQQRYAALSAQWGKPGPFVRAAAGEAVGEIGLALGQHRDAE